MRKLLIILFSLVLFAGNFDQVLAQTPIEAAETIEDPQYLNNITVSELIEPSIPRTDLIRPPYKPAMYHFGQDHRYTVILRGNGEAVVYFRGAFTNETQEPISEVKLGMQDGIKLKQLSAYQIRKKPYCANYNPDGGCQYYTDPDYYEPYSYGGTTEYNKAITELGEESLTVKLSEQVMPGSQGAYLLFYRADGIAHRNALGGYEYDFETFRVDDNLKLVTIGIEGDSGWKFKGADTMIDYVSMTPPVDALISAEKTSPDSRNATFDSMVSSIGYGMINKSAGGLAPMENMVIDGAYAKNYLGLYYKEIGIVATILLVFLALVAILVFKLYRNSKKSVVGDEDTKSKDNTGLMMVISNLLVPTLATIFTVVLIVVFQAVSRMSYMYNIIFPLMLIVSMISLLFFLSIFAGSAIYFGMKKGVGYGLANLLINIFIFLVLMFIMIVVMITFMDNGNQIMPYVGGGGMGVMDVAKPM